MHSYRRNPTKETPSFDYDGYSKSLETILEHAQKEYWAQYVDINNHQIRIFKTYLWASATLVGSYTIALQYLITNKHTLPFFDNSLFSLVFVLISFLCGIGAFGFSFYSIRGAKYKKIPDVRWGEFATKSHEELKNKNENLYTLTLTKLINKYSNAVEFNLASNVKRANRLKWTNWMLLSSLIVAVVSVLLITDIIIISII